MATTGLPEVSVSERSAAQAAELVDAGSDEAFARLTRAATLILDVPLSFVTVIDTTRSWYRSCVGLAPRSSRASRRWRRGSANAWWRATSL